MASDPVARKVMQFDQENRNKARATLRLIFRAVQLQKMSLVGRGKASSRANSGKSCSSTTIGHAHSLRHVKLVTSAFARDLKQYPKASLK